MTSNNSKITSFTVQKKPEENDTLPNSPTVGNLSLDTNLLIMVNKEDFSHILKETGSRLIVVEFFAQWCGRCKFFSTKLEELASAYRGNILIVKVDVDVFDDLALEYNVMALPTVLLVKNQKKLEQFTSSNVQLLKDILEKHVGKPKKN